MNDEATRTFTYDFIQVTVRVPVTPNMTAEQIAIALDEAERLYKQKHNLRKQGKW